MKCEDCILLKEELLALTKRVEILEKNAKSRSRFIDMGNLKVGSRG